MMPEKRYYAPNLTGQKKDQGKVYLFCAREYRYRQAHLSSAGCSARSVEATWMVLFTFLEQAGIAQDSADLLG
jgi:hypothetical protein